MTILKSEPALKSETIVIAAEMDIVKSRQAVRVASVALGFKLVDQTKIVTAASELARNTLVYGKGGKLILEVVVKDQRKGLRMIFEDQGPGIPDLKLAMTDGYTTGGGLGMGLSGAKRLVSEFDIVSRPGEGTRVVATKWM
ncbi:MAG: anti-sigma regulatory factor [Planctomycetia bacterium]|nr:anti-sigma regulatory factor [Planctomycetia bacterium]